MSDRSFGLHTPATRPTRPHRGASAARRYSTSLNDLETAVAHPHAAHPTPETTSLHRRGRGRPLRPAQQRPRGALLGRAAVERTHAPRALPHGFAADGERRARPPPPHGAPL